VNAVSLLRAPADRPAGSRGIRGVAAAVATLAALVTLTYGSRWDMPVWSRFVMLGAGTGLVGAALLLWTARRRGTLVLAVGLIVLAVPAWVAVERTRQTDRREADKWGGAVVSFDDKGAVLTQAEAEAVPKGTTKDEVRELLGPAAGSGIQRVTDGKDLRCVAYRVAGKRPEASLHAFCFTGERYTDLHKW
jgi:hypothetical protein